MTSLTFQYTLRSAGMIAHSAPPRVPSTHHQCQQQRPGHRRRAEQRQVGPADGPDDVLALCSDVEELHAIDEAKPGGDEDEGDRDDHGLREGVGRPERSLDDGSIDSQRVDTGKQHDDRAHEEAEQNRTDRVPGREAAAASCRVSRIAACQTPFQIKLWRPQRRPSSDRSARCPRGARRRYRRCAPRTSPRPGPRP